MLEIEEGRTLAEEEKGAQVEIYRPITIRVLQEFVYMLYRGCGSGLMQVQAVKVALCRL